MVAYVNGVPIPTRNEVDWDDELNDFLTRAGNAYIDATLAPYGADPTGAADSTAAIQAAIDDAVGGAAGAAPVPTRIGEFGTGRVYLPAGYYKITAPLEFYGIQGLTFSGAGPKATYLMASGALTHVLDIVGATQCVWEGFQITAVDQTFSGVAGSVTDSVVRIDWTPAETAGSSNSDEFRWILINNLQFKDGFGVGVNSNGYDVANIRFVHCAVTGNRTMFAADTTKWQAAFRIGAGTHGNILNHYLEFCHLSTMRYGLYVNAVASVATHHSDCSLLDYYAYVLSSGVFAVRDVRIESTAVLIDGAGGAHFASSVVLDNVQFTPIPPYEDPDGRVIRWGLGGAVTIANSQILQAGDTPHVYINSLEPVTISISDTVWKLATKASDLYEVAAGAVYLDVTNVTLINSGNAIVGTIPKAVLTTGGSRRDAINVKDYGATGDGTTDDTTAIQAAITAAAGGTVVFPTGVYVVSSTLTPLTNSVWKGAGARAYDYDASGTVIKYTGTGTAINLSTVAHIRFSDFQLYCSTANAGVIGFKFNDPSNQIMLTNVVLKGPSTAAGTAILMTGQVSCNCHNRFESLYIRQWNEGIRLSGFANANIFENCVIAAVGQGGTGWGINSAATGSDTIGGSDNLFSRVELDGSTPLGIQLTNSSARNVFQKCVEDGVGTTGLSITGTGSNNGNLFLACVISPTRTDSGTGNTYLDCLVAGSQKHLEIGDLNLYQENNNVWATDDKLHVALELEVDGALNHDGTTVGFYGVTPTARPAARTVTNLTVDRSYDCDATTLAELADIVGTLIEDLKLQGLLQ